MLEQLKNYARVFFIVLPILIALDLAWTQVIAGDFYRAYLGYVLRGHYNLAALGLFYVLYTAGIVYFALLPALQNKLFALAFIRGAVLGLVCYAFYDLTNMVSRPDWPLFVSVLDIAWGTILTACTASLSYLLANKLYGIPINQNTTV